ncbi:Uncharacterized protein Fot_41004 [Forsythia ovata]|uniref:Uncharacterized protein n=1 Tax=Forsythia ovata TaxID=205694 RepID=A0ABD1RH11_9LAMI
MVKHSYKLPRSHVPVSGNGTINVPFDLNSVGSKRRPGCPLKPQPEPVENSVPVFVHGVQNSMATLPVNPPNMVVGPGAVYVSVGSVNGAGPAVGFRVKRGRGRPAAEVTKDTAQEAPPELQRSQIRPPATTSDDKSPYPTRAADSSKKKNVNGRGGSGIEVRRQRYISVSKSELLDAIVSAMFSSQEEAREFLHLSE